MAENLFFFSTRSALSILLSALIYYGHAYAQEAPFKTAAIVNSHGSQTPTRETSMRTVVVEWRIKKGQENEFLDYWATRSTIPDRSGLMAEFLHRVESKDQFPWMVWEFSENWTTFVNVGLWREGEDFHQQIGRFIDNSKPPLTFEADRRRRVFLAPQLWRVGNTPMLSADHPQVR